MKGVLMFSREARCAAKHDGVSNGDLSGIPGGPPSVAV